MLLLVIILRTIKLNHANWDSSIIINKNKTKSYMLTWRIWISCPQLPPASFSSARLTRPIIKSSQFYEFLSARLVFDLPWSEMETPFGGANTMTGVLLTLRYSYFVGFSERFADTVPYVKLCRCLPNSSYACNTST